MHKCCREQVARAIIQTEPLRLSPQTESSIHPQAEQFQCTGGVSYWGNGRSHWGHRPANKGCASKSSNFCKACPPLPGLQDKFAAIVACPFGFPQFLRFGVRVFSKVNASVGVGIRGMHGTDEVWVAAVEETAMAPPRLTPTHSGSLGMVGLWSFGLGLVYQKLGCWWRSRNHDCSLRNSTTNPL